MFRLSRKQQLLMGATALMAGVYAFEAHAAVEISSRATANMKCSAGVCAPTAANAVLNAGDLETMLSSGNVTVTTAGSKVQATSIDVDAAVSWSSSNALTLDAYQSIAVYDAVSVDGLSGMSLITDDGGENGTLWFSSKGHITFKNLSSTLSINGAGFTLAADIATLARAIEENPNGNFSLANSYDAKGDGKYSASPITAIGGVFTGLGNTISNLSINDTTTSDQVGLFHTMYSGSTVENLNLSNIDVSGPTGTSSDYAEIGGMVGFSDGALFNDSVNGSISGGSNGYTNVGGLAGGIADYEQYAATVENCYSTASVSASTNSTIGGLVGYSTGTVSQSYATGAVSLGSQGGVGGLVGGNGTYNGVSGALTNSYATGNISGGNASVGGLVGYNDSGATISYSYSTGQPSGNNSAVGGFLGWDYSPVGNLKANYWDTTTSGITSLSQGAGNIPNDPGIAGLSTKQLTAKLPKGFSKKVWKESAKIDGGLPYLISNPPAK